MMSIVWVFKLTFTLMAARLIALAILATVHRKWPRPIPDVRYTPPLAVIIPAYNEEKVIAATVRSVLASDYPNFRIIVINDGSTDGTLSVLEQHFNHNSKVVIVDRPKQGKPSALNHGIELVCEEGFVTIDADTEIATNTLRLMAAHLSDKMVGAIAGNAKVGNRSNLLTWFQASEYIAGWNWERRALDTIQCVTIVPGAIGCWRTNAVRRINGFVGATCAEDTDLTILMHRFGYRITYEDHAVAYTEAPINVQSLVRQRVRWTLGILQALWKHRRGFGGWDRLGRIGLPNLLIYQIILPLLDIIIIPLIILAPLCLLNYNIQHAYMETFHLLSFLLLLLIIELFSSILAFVFEEREPLSLVVIVLMQRIIYRPIITFAVLRALWFLLRRKKNDWNKLDRSPTVKTRTDAST